MVKFQLAFLMIASSLLFLSPSHTLDAAPPGRLDPIVIQKIIARTEADHKAKGYVKYRNGNWGPPLPAGVVMKQDVFPSSEAPPKPGPGHRGNIVHFAETVKDRPGTGEALLKTLMAPDERLEYFHELLKHPAYQLDGWSLSVRKVELVDGTDQFTIHSTPLVSYVQFSANIHVLGWFQETWQLKDGKLTLVKTAPVGKQPIMGIVGF